MKGKIALQLFIIITILAYVALYGYTGITKLLDLAHFEASIRKSEIVKPYAKVLSIGIPTAELIIALLLAIPSTRRTGLYLATSLMFLFTVYVIVILSGNKELPCTCGGFINTMTWREHLIFNIGFLIIGLWSILIIKKNKYAFAI